MDAVVGYRWVACRDGTKIDIDCLQPMLHEGVSLTGLNIALTIHQLKQLLLMRFSTVASALAMDS